MNDLKTLLEREALEEVIGHCRHIIQHFPKNVETYRLLGQALLERGRREEAADIFQRVLGAIPDDFTAHIGLSSAYEDTNIPAAIWHMERAFEQEPHHQTLRDELKRLYAIRDGAAPAQIHLTRGALARFYLRSQLYNQAIIELSEALEATPDRVDLAALLARALWESNHPVEAGDMALQVLKVYPDNLEANRIMASLWLRLSRPSDAAPFISRLEQLDPFLAWAVVHPDGAPVPQNAFQLPRLQWDARTATALATDVPDWVSTIADVFDAPESVALSDSAPDFKPWAGESTGTFTVPVDEVFNQPLSGGRLRMTDRLAQQNAMPLSGDDEVPEWFADMGGAVPQPPPPGDYVPDWLADAAQAASAPLAPGERPAEDALAWLVTGPLAPPGGAAEAAPETEPAVEDALAWLDDEPLITPPEPSVEDIESTEIAPPELALDDIPALPDEFTVEADAHDPGRTGPLPSLESLDALPDAGVDAPDWLDADMPTLEAVAEEPPLETSTELLGEIEEDMDWLLGGAQEVAEDADQPLDLESGWFIAPIAEAQPDNTFDVMPALELPDMPEAAEAVETAEPLALDDWLGTLDAAPDEHTGAGGTFEPEVPLEDGFDAWTTMPEGAPEPAPAAQDMVDDGSIPAEPDAELMADTSFDFVSEEWLDNLEPLSPLEVQAALNLPVPGDAPAATLDQAPWEPGDFTDLADLPDLSTLPDLPERAAIADQADRTPEPEVMWPPPESEAGDLPARPDLFTEAQPEWAGGTEGVPASDAFTTHDVPTATSEGDPLAWMTQFGLTPEAQGLAAPEQDVVPDALREPQEVAERDSRLTEEDVLAWLSQPAPTDLGDLFTAISQDTPAQAAPSPEAPQELTPAPEGTLFVEEPVLEDDFLAAFEASTPSADDDWLGAMAASAPPAAPDSDWLSGVGTDLPPSLEAQAVQETVEEPEAAQDPDEADMPFWQRPAVTASLAQAATALEQMESDEPLISEEDIPAWMREADEDLLVAPATDTTFVTPEEGSPGMALPARMPDADLARPRMDTGILEPDQAPDWLQALSLGEEPVGDAGMDGAAIQEILDSGELARLADMGAVADREPEDAGEAFASDVLTADLAWLQDVGAADTGGQEPETLAESAEVVGAADEAVPAWVRDLALEAVPPAETARPEPVVPLDQLDFGALEPAEDMLLEPESTALPDLPSTYPTVAQPDELVDTDSTTERMDTTGAPSDSGSRGRFSFDRAPAWKRKRSSGGTS
jgi:tetratricopeptide (TPR) repeat protein